MAVQLWAPKWFSKNRTDGTRRNLVWHNLHPAIFRSRSECRDFIDQHYGYIRARPDLQKEPHGWRVPTAVKVKVIEIKKLRSDV